MLPGKRDSCQQELLVFPPHTSSPPDERQQGNATVLNELWQTRVRVGRVGRISWSCLLPALKEASSLMRCFCSPRASPKATERFCHWRGGTCGWDIFISSSLPSLSVQNKSQLVKWERWFTRRKGFPSSICVSPLGKADTCHCGGTAALFLVAAWKGYWKLGNSRPTAWFLAAEEQQ